MNKNVLITGSNRGIGKVILLKCAQNGYNIIAHTRNYKPEFSEELRAIEKEYSVSIRNVCFDLTDSQAIKNGMKEIFDMHIDIDILINNAGVTFYNKPFMMTKIDEARNLYNVNFFAMLEITQYCIKKMIRQKNGCIINMSSICAEDVLPCNTIYGSSKAAVSSFTKNLASEVGKYGIRVNAVAPGGVETDMIAPVMDYFTGEYLETVPLNRLASPNDIADLILFLISDNAKYINGQTVRVDGGRY
ncbi:MAG: SDR family oxidoreductase [Clostridia bacterium]|nr:SDR family oxidoreductase [Clostridia bacterium]